MSFNPDWRVHPGETLKEVLDELGLTPEWLTKETREPILSIIKGECPVTEEIAIRLEDELGITAQFWLNLQANYDKP